MKPTAQFLTENQIAIGDHSYDYLVDPSYTGRLKSLTQNRTVEKTDPTPDPSEEAVARKELVDRFHETASLLDEKGFIREASILDEFLSQIR